MAVVSSDKGQKLVLKQFAKQPGLQSDDATYWKAFKFPTMTKHPGAITHIEFSQAAPYPYIVATSARALIYEKRSNKLLKAITKARENVRAVTFRRDGKTLATAGDDEIVYLFQGDGSSLLRKLRGHKGSIYALKFGANTELLSGGADKTVRVWDIPSEKNVVTFAGHEDYVRTLVRSPTSPNVWFSGGYDHKIIGWDLRTNSSIFTMDHADQLESLLPYPNGTTLVSAGGPNMQVWDLLSGGISMHTITNHQKSVTSLAFDSKRNRLLSASLDQHVKVYDIQNYEVTHSMRYTSPILSMALSPDRTNLVVGMSDGTLSVRKRAPKHGPPGRSKKQVVLHGGTKRHRERGRNAHPSAGDHLVELRVRQPKLKLYEKLLLKFRYRDSLDAVLETKNPVVIVSLLEELSHRNALVVAVAGRDSSSLAPFLTFLLAYVTHPRYANMLLDVTELVLDQYADVMGQSLEIDEMMRKLQTKVMREIRMQQYLAEILGALDMIMSVTTAAAAEEDANDELPAASDE